MGKEAEELLNRVKEWKPAQYETKEEYEVARKKDAEKMKRVIFGEEKPSTTHADIERMADENRKLIAEKKKEIDAIKKSGKNVVESVTFATKEGFDNYFKVSSENSQVFNS